MLSSGVDVKRNGIYLVATHIKTAVIILTIKVLQKIFGQKGQKVPGFIIGLLKVCALGQTAFRLKALLSHRFKGPQH